MGTRDDGWNDSHETTGERHRVKGFFCGRAKGRTRTQSKFGFCGVPDASEALYLIT